MVTKPNHTSGGDDATVSALAGEVETLRRQVEAVQSLPGRVEDLADVVTRLAETTTPTHGPDGGERSGELIGSWLDLPDSPDAAQKLLEDLAGWMGRVYLRYADAARSLPECWAWHPDVVEELVWLHQTWTAAYRTPDAAASMAADWHERHRPGVVARIKTAAGTCSAENHTADRARPTARVPMAAAIPTIAGWWGDDRQSQAPEPDQQQIAAERDQPGGHR